MEEKKFKKKELRELLEQDEKARRILKDMIARSKGQDVPVERDKETEVKLRKLEVINDKGELIVQDVDIKDMLEEALKKSGMDAKEKIVEKKFSFGFSTEYVKKWEAMLQNNGDALTYLAEQVNPKVYGLLNIKKAIVISLVSPTDKWGDRGRCHVLLYGPPGTAKSALGEWLVYNLDIEGISHRSSDVGLTGCAIGKEIVPGALPCANDSSIYIDELDKFEQADMYGLLQAMESGEIIIRVGAVKARFDARCRVIASANKIDKLPPELIDRFDFIIELVPTTLQEELRITEEIVKAWMDHKPTYFGEELRKYLLWIKSYEPEMSKEVKEKAAKLLQMYIEMNEKMRGSMRKKESLIRIATTIAKLHRRPVEVEDFFKAILLSNPAFNGSRLDAIRMVIKP